MGGVVDSPIDGASNTCGRCWGGLSSPFPARGGIHEGGTHVVVDDVAYVTLMGASSQQ
jgi:hypothetical protein